MGTYVGNIRVSINDIIKNWWKLNYFDNGQPFSPTIGYGALYNWKCGVDSRGLASIGWAVPTVAAWEQLVDTFLGGNCEGRLKETGLTHWNTPNNGTTNEFNFNLRGAGYRAGLGDLPNFPATTGDFELKDTTVLWTTTLGYVLTHDASAVVAHPLINPSADVNHGIGGSIRLVKITNSVRENALPDGAAGDPYTGNDGKIYRTVKIGAQVWLADNLNETKFRNGDEIPEVTDLLNWHNTSYGRMCYYNNDKNNA